jgi:hypothetical protein
VIAGFRALLSVLLLAGFSLVALAQLAGARLLGWWLGSYLTTSLALKAIGPC